VREIRACDNLDTVAAKVSAKEYGPSVDDDDGQEADEDSLSQTPTLERQVYGKMADLQLDDGSVRFIGGTSHLLHVDEDQESDDADDYIQQDVSAFTSLDGPLSQRADRGMSRCRIPWPLGPESPTTRSLFCTF